MNRWCSDIIHLYRATSFGSRNKKVVQFVRFAIWLWRCHFHAHCPILFSRLVLFVLICSKHSTNINSRLHFQHLEPICLTQIPTLLKYRWVAAALQMTLLSWHQPAFACLSNQQTVTLGLYPGRVFDTIIRWCWWLKHLIHLWMSIHSSKNVKLDVCLNCFKAPRMPLLLTFCRHLQRGMLYPLVTVSSLFLVTWFADYRYSNRPSRFPYAQRENPQETSKPLGGFRYSNR